MNDFTKEELNIIANALNDFRIIKGKENVLLHKIRTMIDNYCEHEWNGIRYAAVKLRSNDDREYQYKCSKCDKVLFEY